jgi:hypothetical protein
MLCPCCGDKIALEARECGCGARFVGEPLSQPFKIRRYEPMLTALFLLIITASGIYYISRWAAVGSALSLWAALRAVRITGRDREAYGGYRAAVAMLVVTSVGGAVAAAYGINRFSHYLEVRRMRQVAATQAAMYHTASFLESYKRTYGSYPRNEEEIKKVSGEPLPQDNWEQAIRYQSYTEALADGSIRINGISFSTFELRSPGPDGKEGTEDDIIMRNGLFLSASQAKSSR